MWLLLLRKNIDRKIDNDCDDGNDDMDSGDQIESSSDGYDSFDDEEDFIENDDNDAEQTDSEHVVEDERLFFSESMELKVKFESTC